MVGFAPPGLRYASQSAAARACKPGTCPPHLASQSGTGRRVRHGGQANFTPDSSEYQPVSTLYQAAVCVLTTPDVYDKAALTRQFAQSWRNGEISKVVDLDHLGKSTPQLEGRVQSPKRSGDPSPEVEGAKKVVKFIHGVVHAEGCAIDLMWDLIARFHVGELPAEFYDDWVRIAAEEANHFETWAARFRELTGSDYGCFPVRETLWETAVDTKDDLLARLVLVHCVHEARGLDVFLRSYARLNRAGDTASMEILQRSHEEEITHVATAVKWFLRLCDRPDSEAVFHTIVRRYSKNGQLRPPFNAEAREQAGMPASWYLPLATNASDQYL